MNGGGLTEIEFRSTLSGRERMTRVHDSIVRDESLQVANLLQIAFRQRATPNVYRRNVQLALRGKPAIGITHVPFVEDVCEPVISMNGGITFRRGIVESGNGHIEAMFLKCGRGSSGKRNLPLFIYRRSKREAVAVSGTLPPRSPSRDNECDCELIS